MNENKQLLGISNAIVDVLAHVEPEFITDIGAVVGAMNLIDEARAHDIYDKMGPARYHIGMQLFLWMMIMPIKMYCRWMFNLKYFVHIQEFFFNI